MHNPEENVSASDVKLENITSILDAGLEDFCAM